MEIVSGVFEGMTTGAPLTLLIKNRDIDSKPYEILRHVLRVRGQIGFDHET